MHCVNTISRNRMVLACNRDIIGRATTANREGGKPLMYNSDAIFWLNTNVTDILPICFNILVFLTGHYLIEQAIKRQKIQPVLNPRASNTVTLSCNSACDIDAKSPFRMGLVLPRDLMGFRNYPPACPCFVCCIRTGTLLEFSDIIPQIWCAHLSITPLHTTQHSNTTSGDIQF